MESVENLARRVAEAKEETLLRLICAELTGPMGRCKREYCEGPGEVVTTADHVFIYQQRVWLAGGYP